MKKLIVITLTLLMCLPYIRSVSRFDDSHYDLDEIIIVGAFYLDIKDYVIIYTKGNYNLLPTKEFEKYKDSIGYSFLNNLSCYLMPNIKRIKEIVGAHDTITEFDGYEIPVVLREIIKNDKTLFGNIATHNRIVKDSVCGDGIILASFEGKKPNYFVLCLLKDRLYNKLFWRWDSDTKVVNHSKVRSKGYKGYVKVLFPVYQDDVK